MPVSILAKSVAEDASKVRLIMMGDMLPYWTRFQDAYQAVTPEMYPCIAYEFDNVEHAASMAGIAPEKLIKVK